MLRYCTKCVMPDSKPDLFLDAEQVCSACRSFERRSEIDWDARREELQQLLGIYRSDGSTWDCVVPVSGGKDSTFQVVTALEMGMTPLCVTATTCDLSDIGRRNIQNIKRLGVDHVEFSPNPRVRARLNRIGLEEVGDISWPEHVGIFTIPIRVAVNYGIRLVLWGENSQNEYGGPRASQESITLDRAWLEEFGGLLGLRVGDLSEAYGLDERHLIPYRYPSGDELERVGLTGIFLGQFVQWDGMRSYLVAQSHGFETWPTVVEGSMVSYENLDNHQTGIHDYFKYLKFGFSRASDIASLHVRRGRLSRDEALSIVRHLDGRFPWTYLGKKLEDILRPLDLTVDAFVEICDRFTNRQLFLTAEGGDLLRDEFGNLTKVNYDNL
jgi:N-acetyl sugar amidotransferase